MKRGKILIWFLALALLVSFVNALCSDYSWDMDIYAAYGHYGVNNCNLLQNINDTDCLGRGFMLANDIDCSDTVNWNSGAGFNPIGDNNNKFNGTFNGWGYAITNLYINRSSEDYIGLFGYTKTSAVISNVSLKDVDIKGSNYVGGLIGKNNNSNVAGAYGGGIVNGSDYVGGLIGLNDGDTISNSFASVNVAGSNYVGGLVGSNFNSGTVSNSYAIGNVIGSSNLGGLVGSNAGSCSSSYWDNQTSGQTTSSCGVGKTTAEMKMQSTFSGWDFNNTWSINSLINNGYPYLNLQRFEISYSSFSGDTTDFSNVPDPDNVANAVVATSTGAIAWNNNINVNGADLDSNIVIGNGFVSLDAENLDQSMNSSADISMVVSGCDSYTIYHAPGFYTTFNDIKTNGQICNATSSPSCTNIVCANNILNFTIEHFSGFGVEAYGTAVSRADEEEEARRIRLRNIPFVRSDPFAKRIFTDVSAGKRLELDPSRKNLALEHISFTILRFMSKVTLWVEKLEENPVGVEPPQNVYQFINIDVNVAEEDLEEALLRFSVPDSWLSENGLSINDVSVYVFEGGQWVELNQSGNKITGFAVSIVKNIKSLFSKISNLITGAAVTETYSTIEIKTETLGKYYVIAQRIVAPKVEVPAVIEEPKLEPIITEEVGNGLKKIDLGIYQDYLLLIIIVLVVATIIIKARMKRHKTEEEKPKEKAVEKKEAPKEEKKEEKPEKEKANSSEKKEEKAE